MSKGITLKELKRSNQLKTNMSARVPVEFRDRVAAFCDKHDVAMSDFIRYSLERTMEDEKVDDDHK